MGISEIEKETLDLDWFATDRDGHVAQFTTGGRGAIPPHGDDSVADLRAKSQLVESLLPFGNDSRDGRLLASEMAGGSFFPPATPGTCREFLHRPARRGIFSFDSITAEHRPTGYFLAAAPLKPVQVATIPPTLGAMLRQIEFTDISFASSDFLSVADVMSARARSSRDHGSKRG